MPGRRGLVLGSGAAAAVAAAGPPLLGRAAAQARDLTIVSWGGAYQDAQREVFFRPFAQRTRTRILEETWDGGIGVLRARVASGANTWDVVQVEGHELLLGAAEGLFEPLDWDAIGGRDAYVPEAVHPCGVGAVLSSLVLAWDRARLPEDAAPRGWADLFDTRRFPGRRALRRGPRTTLEIALLGDGVPPGEVYRLLGTRAGVERAFARLDSIREALGWWERGSQSPLWLASGEVTLGAAYSGRIWAANAGGGRDLGLRWSGHLFAMDFWVVMKDSPNRAQALEFLRFVGRPEVQAELPPRIPYGMTARGVNERLPPQVAQRLPTAHLDQGLRISDAFWAAHLDALTRRFERWLGG
ncbi:ABC transporter substrate-binding protein [Caldovatus aquaticus]|uniref:ABC transporter substrate-binding protein n=1 Tax=Caldovatus aquaticus TaxID=2865671 RepID=A0ABS7F099_9PROT|nr:ABC transporter substrate-binding protein [Caldovatus aquaticus]MBW8268387.1 ABC transporter substrate-binding protein [Caldovatus aquaticus]